MSHSTLIDAYRQVGVPLDRLPYSGAMTRVRELVEQRSGRRVRKRRLWQVLLRLRKNSKLPRLVRA